MTLRNKLLISFSMLIVFFLTLASSVHAADYPSKAEGKGIQCESTFWMTSNIDPEKAMEFLSKYMIWDSTKSYNRDPDGVDYIELDYEIKQAGEDYMLYKYFKAGYGQNKYGSITRLRVIESVNGAEYIIGATNYDCYTIVVDGNTYKGDLGDLLNTCIANEHSYQENPKFTLPYKICCDYELRATEGMHYTDEAGSSYMAYANGFVAFNLTKDSYKPDIKDSVDDYIYGGDSENKLDDTPTEKKDEEEKTTSSFGKIFGITISVLAGIVLIYISYIVGKKIYELTKEN